jgi:metallo-beta-lactamase class B
VAAVVAGIRPQDANAQAASARDFAAEIEAERLAAREAAGREHLGTLARLCIAPGSGTLNTTDNVPRYVRDPATVPPRDRWYAESAQVYDELYYVGGSQHSSWALVTSEGIIIIDTIYPYNSEELIIGGLERLGLDPARIRYVVISHAHGDHIGGAQILQERYDARVVMGAADWDLVERYPNRYATMAPSRDIVAEDGMEITLGESSVTLWETPGHTPGTLSYTFTVHDDGRPVTVAYSGGTAFNFPNSTPDPGIRNFQTYIDSQRHIEERAARAGATVLLSNHPIFDGTLERIRLIAVPGDGPHPFEIGEDMVQRYFQVQRHCARAAQIELERRAVVS